MIIETSNKINKEDRILNCRIQALCDLLAMKNILILPKLLYLACMKSLYYFTEILYGTSSFNRMEIAESVQTLYNLYPNGKLKDLYIGFYESANLFRNIIRKLFFAERKQNEKSQFITEVKEMFLKFLNTRKI